MALGDIGHDAKPFGREVLHGRFPATADEAAPLSREGAASAEVYTAFARSASLGNRSEGPGEFRGGCGVAVRGRLDPDNAPQGAQANAGAAIRLRKRRGAKAARDA